MKSDDESSFLEIEMKSHYESTLKTWYSDSDGVRLLRIIRARNLTYSADLYKDPGLELDYYARRENDQRVLVADLCAGNFKNFLDEDINFITSHWTQMPTMIVLTFLSGSHFRAARIQIDYTERKLDILWDDPYGSDKFPRLLKDYIRSCLDRNSQKLANRHIVLTGAYTAGIAAGAPLVTITETVKKFDQQGI